MERLKKAVDGRGDDSRRPQPTPDETGEGAVTAGERIPGGGTGTPPGEVSDVGRTGPGGGERAPGGGVRLGTSIGDTGKDPAGAAPAREWPLRSDQRK